MDNCQSGDGEVEGLTDEYTELEVLSMVNVGLKSLAKLPSLPKLRKVSSPRRLPVPRIVLLSHVSDASVCHSWRLVITSLPGGWTLWPRNVPT